METNDIDINWKSLFQPIMGLKTDCFNRICIEREVIPIIFVPGIMGSRLVRASDNVKLWDPDDPGFMVKKYGWKQIYSVLVTRKYSLRGQPRPLFSKASAGCYVKG